jgi:hypothetical protein
MLLVHCPEVHNSFGARGQKRCGKNEPTKDKKKDFPVKFIHIQLPLYHTAFLQTLSSIVPKM